MADSLVLKGVKDVSKHTGTEMQIIRSKRGGDTHQLKEWWKVGGVSTCYVDCTVFNVTVGGTTCKLALNTSAETDIRIDHATAAVSPPNTPFTFQFIGMNEVSRAALFTDTYELIEHYLFPSISGGPIVKVIPAGAPVKPDGNASINIGTVSITGEQSPVELVPETYQVESSGNASPTYVLTSSNLTDTINGLEVTFSSTGARTLTATATDVSASDDGASGTLLVTPIADPNLPPGGAPTIGNVTITGEQSPTDGDSENYTVTIDGTANPSYVLESSEGGDTINGLNVTFQGAGNRTLTATATDAAASDNGAQGTLSITVAAAAPGNDVVTLTTPADWTTTNIDNKYYGNDPGQCNGSNTIPAFSWSHTGPSTVATWELALEDTLDDSSTFLHYLVLDIPAATVSNTEGSDPSGGTVDTNDNGTQDYFGPCPPQGSGQHTYTWTIVAVAADGSEIARASQDTVIDAPVVLNDGGGY